MTDSTEILEKLNQYENEEAYLIETVKELDETIETAIRQVATKYNLDETTATGKVNLYW